MLSQETRNFLEKVAYSYGVHDDFLRQAFKRSGRNSFSKRTKELIRKGDLGTDVGIRTPLLLINDPVHALQSSTRAHIRKTIQTHLNSGIGDIADAIVKGKGFRSDMKAARGLMDIGTAHHTLMDLTSHNEKMRAMGLKHKGRKTGFGGAIRAIRQHLANSMEMDKFNPKKNPMDRIAGTRNLRFLGNLVPKLQTQLQQRGMHSSEARKAAKTFFAKADPGTFATLGGMLTRNTRYVKERAKAAIS